MFSWSNRIKWNCICFTQNHNLRIISLGLTQCTEVTSSTLKPSNPERKNLKILKQGKIRNLRWRIFLPLDRQMCNRYQMYRTQYQDYQQYLLLLITSEISKLCSTWQHSNWSHNSPHFRVLHIIYILLITDASNAPHHFHLFMMYFLLLCLLL